MKQLSFDFDKRIRHYQSGKTVRVPWQLLWVRDKSWRMDFMRRRYKNEDSILSMVVILNYLDTRK